MYFNLKLYLIPLGVRLRPRIFLTFLILKVLNLSKIYTDFLLNLFVLFDIILVQKRLQSYKQTNSQLVKISWLEVLDNGFTLWFQRLLLISIVFYKSIVAWFDCEDVFVLDYFKNCSSSCCRFVTRYSECAWWEVEFFCLFWNQKW